MAKPRQLSAPPIVEAVLDVRVNFAEPPSLGALASIAARLPGYNETQRIEHTLQVQFVPSGAGGFTQVPPPPLQVGVSYRSADEHWVIQSRRDGMSLSRLKPYIDWDPIFDEMWRAWIGYREVLRPTRVARVSTRFINQIQVPVGQDLDDYFLIGPRLPEGAPGFFSTFSSAVSIPFPELKTNAIIRMAMPFSSDPTMALIILDLDILHECDFASSDDSGIQGAIRALRPLKNQLFFGSLTEKALELFQ